eukprot:TRINITY_DN7570_c0_g1_i7.p1 TRINITY_DN7570_c0_g1~~TRINITY_DN7570_c0_g1_i7.p1  ORF type:complete len:244 (+),score=64.79 TRINITY_DN7570_c0_g1_i7:65-796(+)
MCIRDSINAEYMGKHKKIQQENKSRREKKMSNKKDNIDGEKDSNPYEKFLNESENKLESPVQESARQRKIKLIKKKYHELKGNFISGAIMGSLVGGGFGFVWGLYSAVANRSIWILPIATLSSAASFGFLLGCGALIRNDDLNRELIKRHMKESVVIYYKDGVMYCDQTPLWLRKLRVQANHLQDNAYLSVTINFVCIFSNSSDDLFSGGKIPQHCESSYLLCLLYTSPSPRDGLLSRMPSSA